MAPLMDTSVRSVSTQFKKHLLQLSRHISQTKFGRSSNSVIRYTDFTSSVPVTLMRIKPLLKINERMFTRLLVPLLDLISWLKRVWPVVQYIYIYIIILTAYLTSSSKYKKQDGIQILANPHLWNICYRFRFLRTSYIISPILPFIMAFWKCRKPKLFLYTQQSLSSKCVQVCVKSIQSFIKRY